MVQKNSFVEDHSSHCYDWFALTDKASSLSKRVPSSKRGVVDPFSALHRFRVTPIAEQTSEGPMKWILRPGTSYIALDLEPRRAFEVFSDLIQHGHFGLCVTRSSPDTIRESYGLRTTPIRWLASLKRDDVIAPSDLLGLSLTVVNFVQNASQPVVILHGIEFLVAADEFKPVLKLIQRINDVIIEKKGVLILPLVPGSIGEQAQAQLTAECARLPSSPD